MSDDDKALVERLRWGVWHFDNPYDGEVYSSDDPLIAADRIEEQAAEIERLRGLLKAAPAPSDYDRPENYNMAYINWDQRVRHALAGKAEQ
jgi:hypothetical protein